MTKCRGEKKQTNKKTDGRSKRREEARQNEKASGVEIGVGEWGVMGG